MAITVLVADPKSVSRQELVGLLGRDRNLEVLGDAREGNEAVEMSRSLRPDVVLLDGSVSSPDAVSTVESLLLASGETAVIVLIDGVNMDMVRRLMRSGARDVLVKPVAVDDLLSTIRTVHHAMSRQRAAMESGLDTGGGGGISSRSTRLRAAAARAFWPPTWASRWPKRWTPRRIRGAWPWSISTCSLATSI
jgi:pilus assembly protein CpaE